MMHRMVPRPNVLISCGGKWVGTALQMRRAMDEIDQLADGALVIADSAPVTPAAHFADRSVQVPRLDHDEYVEELLAACLREDVGVVIPLIDPDLRRLTHHLARFADHGVVLVCPPPDLLETLLDKSRFERFADGRGLPCVPSIDPAQFDSATYPLHAKPRQGSGSVGTVVCSDGATAQAAYADNPELIFQPLVTAAEYSVDCFINNAGDCTVRVPRARAKVVSGEAYVSRTGAPGAVIEVADATLARVADAGLTGPLNVQIFASDPPLLSEINPRLGSAAVASNAATGGRLYRSILTSARGELATGDPDDFIAGLEMIRYPGEIHHVDGSVVAAFPSSRSV